MRIIKETILKTNTLEDLLPLLDGLAEEVRIHAGDGQLTAEQLQEMASYLMNIRQLLNMLQQEDSLSGGTIRWRADRYVELEGKIKEMRNDLDRAMQKSSL